MAPARAVEDAAAQDIAIVGRSCRVPGAGSVAAFWRLLIEGRCAVTSIPADRWTLARHLHPRLAERGKTYTWAAGVLDDIWSFDPGAFGISPREAEQMDPQQRLLLELAWEALEDAGIRSSRIAGTDTGVFIGASAVDHANLRMLDMSAADAYMMTGNTLSILSNRLSHIFDLHGPSFTIDTACSSSLVAVHEAVSSLRSGRIDTAIVGGVGILASPQSFVGFSQAAMLSRRGLCQAFASEADGYVRAEGGVVLVLKTLAGAKRDGDHVHALITDCAINSDGHTNGISLPSKKFQSQLLERLYRDIDPDALAFIETHGTGTPVGDPIEATALGEALGRFRATPLLIGSVKTNIGHMEAASGLGGLLKAMLALEHDLLPASLHSATLNPAIDFEDLNLEVARALTPLVRSHGPRRLAGVNSFGFGGTNAHVTLADALAAPPTSVETPPSYLVLSGQSRAALEALVADYATRLREADDDGAIALLAATAQRRDLLSQRMAMPVGRRADMVTTLERVRDGEEDVAGAARGHAIQRAVSIAFVFSGNGSQFAGMGRAAYARNESFRARFATISASFAALANWSLVDMLHADDLAARITRAQVAQPLLFAIQSAACHTLRQHGLEPSFVIGHSFGEVAAAEAAGILDNTDALKVIIARSSHQELAFDHGGMAVVIGAEAAIKAILAELPRLEIAAFNSPRAFTLSGSKDDIARLSEVARGHKVRVRRLDLAYPFHSAGMAPVRDPLRRDLAELTHRPSLIPFLSTVTGAAVGVGEDAADYWWRNVREPVCFSDAVAAAVNGGARVFVEIGPMATLLSHVNDTIDERTATVATIAAMDKRDRGIDPLAMAVAAAIARGAEVDETKAYGSGPAAGASVALPHYPWQRTSFRLPETSEALGGRQSAKWHPLIGGRVGDEPNEWRSCLDTMLVPSLADHCIDGCPILPGAAFVEMALAVARDAFGSDSAIIRDLEITSPMPLARDTSREVACRFAAGTSQVEIVSRPRLGGTPWQIHATAKTVRDTTKGTLPELGQADAVKPSAWVDGREIYAMAARVGLHFGPAYRKLARAVALRPDCLRFDLTEDVADPAFGLDPARLDSCFHALLLIFANRRELDPATAYVPVRFGAIVLRKPGATIAAGRIDVSRCDARVIVADVRMTDATGDVVAIVREARFQAMRTSAPAILAPIITRTLLLASEPAAVRRDPALALATFRRGIVGIDSGAPMADDYVLLEGWATSLAFRLARDLATAHIVDVDELVTTGRLPSNMRSWFEAVLGVLERSGLCHRTPKGVHVDAEIALPDPDAILRTIACEHQALSVELLVASSALIAANAMSNGAEPRPLARRIVNDFEVGSSHAQASALCLTDLVRASLGGWPKDRAIRILQIGFGPLTHHAVALAKQMQARLTIFEPDPHDRESVRLTLADRADIDIIEGFEERPASGFDLVIASYTLGRHIRSPRAWAGLRRALAPGAIFAAIEPPPSFFRDFILGLDACLSHGASAGDGASSGAADWLAAMQSAGLGDADVEHVATSVGTALLATAQVGAVRRHWSGVGAAIIVGDESCRTHTTFATLLASAGLHISMVRDSEDVNLTETPFMAVMFAQEADELGAPATRVLEQCLRLKRLVDRLGQWPIRLWLVTSGAVGGGDRGDADVMAALWAFSRTIANEVPSLDLRRVDVVGDPRSELLADRLRDLVLSDTDETEIVISQTDTRVVRFESGNGEYGRDSPKRAAPPEVTSLATAAVGLHRKLFDRKSFDRKSFGHEALDQKSLDRTSFDQKSWLLGPRRAPGHEEVEIAVEAIGLNFRDVMLGLGLLPEDMLEDGFAGPNFGLECTGRIARVGPGVRGLKRGDRVMAFARNAFSTHAMAPSAVVAPIPAGIPIEAAATIPVAFLTAYYALVTCARLKRNEWILIHGGAGGVGLAALQIARSRGARVIATAGAAEKRVLLQSLGAEHVFDSRSGSFVEDVRRVTGRGVAVVLNSLSGEAMERSIALLRPFGRFVELGKRDYAANTHIGLRPFRRNLSYFGVDLDQLLVDEPTTGGRLMRSLARLFERDELVPLPFRVFEGAETADAFRLMRQSGHVGKLVVRPPRPAAIAVHPKSRFKASTGKIHLVTGGFGGFGLETARWLAAAGARRIMLVGRNGPATEEARAVLSALAARGVRIEVEALDVADRGALQRLFVRFGRDLPPLAGVIHAAMVLEDGLLADLTAETMDRVLRPKVTGADNLDQLTRAMPLDYFILYSSAAVLLGNPGQAAYVAANGYLEGLARRRRHAGLPALAVAWGAIEDVGILSRSEAARDLLAARAGVKGLKAQEALGRLGDILAAPSRLPEDAVVAIATIDWSTARNHLAILKSPTYRQLAPRGEATARDIGQTDIATIVAKMAPEAARTLVSGVIAEEIAHVLRLPPYDVPRTIALSEIGLDSLMTVEFALRLASRFRLDAPMLTQASSCTVHELADHLIGLSTGLKRRDDPPTNMIVCRHLDAQDAASLRTLVD